MDIKKGDHFIQKKVTYTDDGKPRGMLGCKVQIDYVGKRGQQWVDFTRLDNGKQVIGQYRVHNFFDFFTKCI